MHEQALAQQILGEVLEQVMGQDVRVLAVRGWVADEEAVTVEGLQAQFDQLAQGTPAQGARLEIDLTHPGSRCLDCGQERPLGPETTMCGTCGSADAELLGPSGVGIDSLDTE